MNPIKIIEPRSGACPCGIVSLSTGRGSLFLENEIKFNLVKAKPIKETSNYFLDISFLFCILVLLKTEMKMLR